MKPELPWKSDIWSGLDEFYAYRKKRRPGELAYDRKRYQRMVRKHWKQKLLVLVVLLIIPSALSSHPPINLGDANGDGVVNLGDAAYIVNYVMLDGPPPVTVESVVLERLDNIKVLLEFYMTSGINWPCSCQYVNPDTAIPGG